MVHLPKEPRFNPQIGDYIARAGIYTKPGVVTEKREDGQVVIDTSEEEVQKYHRHTNTTGLSAEEKEKFNGIMDAVMQQENNTEKIKQLQEQIDQLRKDPVNKKVVQWLNNEQAQLIRYAKELPKVYQFEQSKLHQQS